MKFWKISYIPRQVQFAMHFEKSAGLQRAEDSYLKAFGEIALAIVELGQVTSYKISTNSFSATKSSRSSIQTSKTMAKEN